MTDAELKKIAPPKDITHPKLTLANIFDAGLRELALFKNLASLKLIEYGQLRSAA